MIKHYFAKNIFTGFILGMKIRPDKTIEIFKPVIKEIHGINPRGKNETTGVFEDLPRFCSVEMQQARNMNKVAKRNLYQIYSNRVPKNATAGDIERLTAMDYDSSQMRAVWINPKDFKPYYLLKENTADNVHELKILNSDGVHIKDVEVKPKEVILCDLSEGDKTITPILGHNFNHSDLMGSVASSYNPFANYSIYKFNNDDEILELVKDLPENVSCVAMSFGTFLPMNFDRPGKEIEKNICKNLKKCSGEKKFLAELKKLSNATRVLMCAGNDGNELNTFLLKTGFEGVGGLNKLGMVDQLSGSKSSYFTQHYEPFVYPIKTTADGVNITGLRGTDILLPHELEENISLGRVRGTSFSTPVRAAKIALTNMMTELGL